MEVKLIAYTKGVEGESPEKIIELAARTSYRSFSKMEEGSEKKLIRHLIKLGHLSVLEHASATFDIKGISRVCAQQLLRHRLLSAIQESQRYVNQLEQSYIIPDSVAENDKIADSYKKTIDLLTQLYKGLVDSGIAKEDARFILPQGIATNLVVSGNFREWLHIIELRVSMAAQWEIRELVTRIWKELHQIAPTVFDIESFKDCKDYEIKKEIFFTHVRGLE